MLKRMHITLLFLLCLFITYAQDTLLFKSKYLLNTDTVLVFKPSHYNPSKAYPLVYLLHGYSQDYKQWSHILPLQTISDENDFIIVCPDGFVSWFVNSPNDSTSRMEDFFFKELVPRIHSTVNVDKLNVFISGLSMGGYGALRYFLLHPGYFNTAGSTSGGTEVDYTLLKAASMQFFGTDRVTKDLSRLLAKNWHQYNITTLLTGNTKPFIFDCGTDDILYPSFLKLQQACKALHIPATSISQPGDHNETYWHNSIQAHFNYFNAHKKRSSQK